MYIYIAHRRKTSNTLHESVHCKQKRLLGVCRKCLCQLPDLSGSLTANSTPTGHPLRRAVRQMYSAMYKLKMCAKLEGIKITLMAREDL